MEARRNAPVSTHDFFGALVRPINAITTSTNIAASQAQEHQQWRTTPSELRRAQDFIADLIYIWSGRGIYTLLGIFPPAVHATLDQMPDIVATW